MSEAKLDLSEIKKDLVALGKDEAEDVLKGAVEILAKLPALLITKYPWVTYILPFVPMIVKVLNEAIDKIDGKEG